MKERDSSVSPGASGLMQRWIFITGGSFEARDAVVKLSQEPGGNLRG